MIKQITPLGSSTAHDISARYMHSSDTRSTVINPNELVATKNGIQFDFKQASVTGLTGYSGVLSYRPYASNSDWSGGPAHQIAFNNSNGLYWRVSTGDTTWGDWKQLVTNSGTWGISITGNAATSSSCTGNAATATKATQDASGNVITSTYVKKAGDTMTGTLKLVNDTQNDASDALLYVQHKSNNDWNVIIDSTGYNYGLDVRTAAWANWGIKLNGLIHWDLRDATSAKNTIYNLAYLSFKNSQNSVEYSAPLIRYIGTDGTDGYNAGVLYGSTNGTTWVTAGESGATLPTVLSAYNDEHLYLSADGAVRIYSGCSNDGATHPLSFEARTNGYCYGNRIYNAVWNDYAEFRITKEEIEPGRCIVETGKGDLVLSTERLQEGCEIVSDTYGFAIGENEKCKTPTACAGRVLAYLYEDNSLAKPGRPVCSGPNGTVSLMTNEEAREYPWCIIGTISEIPNYDIWYAGQDKQEKIKVNGRIWIRIR